MDRQFSFRCHPWDIEDEGVDAALGRLAGDLGIDTVTITATHPGIYQVRPRPLGGRRTFESAAAAHFLPDSARYGSSRIRPHAAAWLKNRNPLERIARVAERERLSLRARISCLKGEELVSRYTHAACVNVFGDPSREWLCASNPDVREYVASLIDDLWTNYGLDAVELEDLDARDERTLVACRTLSNNEALGLTSGCFCASCRQRANDAGLDLDAVRTALIDQWQTACNGRAGQQPDPSSGESSDALIGPCVEVRAAAIASFLQSIKKRLPAALRYVHPSMPSGVSDAASKEAGIAIMPVSTVATGGLAGWQIDRATGVEVMISTQSGAMRDGPALVALVHQLAESGCGGIGFDHYGVTSESGLDGVRQAVRYARRDSGG